MGEAPCCPICFCTAPEYVEAYGWIKIMGEQDGIWAEEELQEEMWR